mgnify:CR=1 FL=1
MMSDKRIKLTRRKILAGTTAVGAAGIGAGFGTGALFSDQESFANNELTAGELDLTVHYESSLDQDGVSTDSTTESGTIDGNPAERSYQVADLKPGDSGSIEFCFSVVDNPAFMRVQGELTENAENGQTDPEADVDHSGGDPGEGNGELADAIDATLRYCTDGNEPAEEEEVISRGSLSNVLSGLRIGAPLDGAGNVNSAERTPLQAQSNSESTAEPCVCLEWNVPTDVGNEIQTDSVGFELSFIAEQSRHNDGIDIGSGRSGHYPLDTVQDGIADDVSVNDNNGTIEGDVSSIEGQVNDAGSFDGDGDYVLIDGLVTESDSVTLMAWIRYQGSGQQEIVSIGDHVGLRAHTSGDYLRGFFHDGSSWQTTITGAELSGGEWHHVAYVVDSENDAQTVYVDGINVESTSHSQEVDYSGLGGDTTIGMHGNGDDRYFVGDIDEVMIYDRALSSAEVQAIYDYTS